MFPVYILDDKTVLPKTGTFYVVAGNGIFLSKDTGLIRAMVKVDGISVLKSLKATAELRMPMISSTIIAQSLLFFRRVYSAHKSEAITLLYYSQEKQEFAVNAPPQKVSGASVKYEPEAKFGEEGLQLVGSIHSHSDFGAFHSGTDIHDEENFDGVHITIGRVDQPYFTISVTVAVNNNRFRVDAEQAISGIKKVDYSPPPKFFGYKRTLGIPRDDSKFDFSTPPWLQKLLQGAGELDYFSSIPAEKVQFYDLVLPDGLDYRNFPVSTEWLKRVKKSWSPFFGKKEKEGDVEELLPIKEDKPILEEVK